MFGLPGRIVVFDTEVTTWEGAASRNWSGPGEHRELVQLGAALVETTGFAELGTFKRLVRPMINPTLSDYFINLTGITREKVNEEGVHFNALLESFCGWCGQYALYTYDKVGILRLFDRDVLIENCDLHGLKFPFEMERFHNINEIFVEHGIVVVQSGRAPEAFGEKPKQRSHDALNDVRGLIRGLQLLENMVSK